MATLESVRKDLEREIREINTTGLVGLLGRMANQAHRSSLNRIFTDGIKSDGSAIGSPKPSTVKFKKKTGRPTVKLTLRQTDTLAGSYTFERNGKFFQLGFVDVNRADGGDNGDIARFNEARFGKIFDLTKKELDELDIIINNYTKGIF